jgi:transcriptional antiterminator NusG
MSEHSSYKWYVVRAISGKEKKVKEYLESEINRLGIQDYIKQVLIPTEKVYQIRKGKKVSKERNYFPGYVLIEADLSGEIPHIVKNVPDVLGFLGTRGNAEPMRASEVKRILGKVDELAE